MATVTKDFKVKHGLIVEGQNGTIGGSDIITEDKLTSGTQNGVSVTYNSQTGNVDFDLADPNITISGDVDGSSTMTDLGNVDIQVTLDTVNANVGSFGGSTSIPTFTVNEKGLVTAAGEVDVATNLSIAGDTGTDTVSLLTDTLTFLGGKGMIVEVTDNTVTSKINIGPGLEESADVLQIDSTVVTQTGTQTLSNKTLGTDLDAGSFKVTNLSDPTSAQDAATKVYVDSVAQGLDVKQSVRVATSENLASLSGLITVDNITLVAGDRVLVKSQTTASENGIYVVSDSAWTRSADADAPNEMNAGTFVFVEEGAVYADTGWVVSSDNPLTIGTDPIVWTQFSGAGTYLAGYGLTLTGNTFAVDDDEIVNHTELNTAVSDLTDYIDGFLDPSTGTTVEYIDQQDAATLLAANGYSDALVAAGDATATPTYLALDINSVAKQVAATYSGQNGVAEVAYSWLKAEYRSAEFLVKVQYGTHTEVSKVILTLDTSDNIAITEYAVVGTNGSMSTISASISDGSVQLVVTPNGDATILTVGTLLV